MAEVLPRVGVPTGSSSILESFRSLVHSRDKTVVIDIGSSYTKCGLAGKAAPRVVVPTRLFTASGKQLSLQHGEKVTENEWRQAIEILLREILIIKLGIGSGYRGIVVDSLINPILFRKALIFVLLKRFKMENLKYLIEEASGIFSLIPLPPPSTPGVPASEIGIKLRDTCLLVNVGFRETRALPIYNNLALISKFIHGGVGVSDLLSRLRSLLQEFGAILTQQANSTPLKSSCKNLKGELLEDVLKRTCFVCLRGYSPALPPVLKFPPPIKTCLSPENPSATPQSPLILKLQKPSHSRKRSDSSAIFQDEIKRIETISYALPDGNSLEINGYIRSHASDILFEHTEDFPSIPSVILDSLLLCDVDTRCELAGSILLSGGICTLPGFYTRILEEIEELLEFSKYKELKPLSGRFNIFSTPYSPATLPWVGASLIGSLEDCSFNISAESYENNGAASLPNWFNFA